MFDMRLRAAAPVTLRRVPARRPGRGKRRQLGSASSQSNRRRPAASSLASRRASIISGVGALACRVRAFPSGKARLVAFRRRGFPEAATWPGCRGGTVSTTEVCEVVLTPFERLACELRAGFIMRRETEW
jgi:hypothetical protein